MKFNPADFESLIGDNGDFSYDNIAKAANILLQERLDAAPTVFGYVGNVSSSWHSKPPGTYIQENISHKAKLICIEKLEEKK